MQEALKRVEVEAEKFMTKHQERRDEWNTKVVNFRTQRDQINGQKRELYDEIERQRGVRDKENSRAREAKTQRREANEKYLSLREELFGPEEKGKKQRKKGDTVESIKKRMNSLELKYQIGGFPGRKGEDQFRDEMTKLSRKLRELQADQSKNQESFDNPELKNLHEIREAAHREVIESADAAQAAHDLMGKLQAETKRMNGEHETAHRSYISAKTEADLEHQYYIVAMRCVYSARHLTKAIQDRADGIQPSKVEATSQNIDLMSALMSGQALTTEQLMAMKRKD
ncbi:MAG: hypothetical protein CMO20_04150 [Thermoplasmata archaeon]|nr:hypothetical protein [Thermoplasmata archaeon]|tara:strand:- start:1155 stop:2009 length:855 start_codon:yes stop_codon:yes gene_type:complete